MVRRKFLWSGDGGKVKVLSQALQLPYSLSVGDRFSAVSMFLAFFVKGVIDNKVLIATMGAVVTDPSGSSLVGKVSKGLSTPKQRRSTFLRHLRIHTLIV